jgi:CHASE3 domain sensor protein
MMVQEILNVAKQVIRPASQLWQHVPLHLQGKIQVALPLLAVIVSAVLAILGHCQHARIEAAMQRQFQTVASLNEVLTLMVNAETGMRGYLLTKHEEFLQPYATASHDLPVAMSQMRVLAKSEPEGNLRINKLRLLSELQTLINQQMLDLAWQERNATLPNISNEVIFNHLALGKHLMDQIRDNIGGAQTEEWGLLTQQVQRINAIRRRDYLAVFLALVVGLGTRLVAWCLFNAGIIRKVEHPVKNMCTLRQGNLLPFPPFGEPGALGELEKEIGLMGKQLTAPRGGGCDEQTVTS